MTIPEPRFYLKDPSSSIPTLIYLQAKYSFNGQQRVMLTTGDKILPKEWDFIKQRSISNKRNIQNQEINSWLDKIHNTFKAEFRNFLINGTVPNANEIKEKIELALNLRQESNKASITFYRFMEMYIEESRGNKAPNTVKTYVSTRNRIIEYGKYTNKEFDFIDMTPEWRNGFLKYLQSLNVSRNTEGKHIKQVKLFLNEATERGLNSQLSFKNKSFSKPTEDVYKIFLTLQEIDKILQLDLTNDASLDIVRDYFVVSCFTALRYSDLVNIKPYHIKDGRIRMITKKTGKEIVLPISHQVQSILQKYNYQLPQAPTNQYFNRSLKIIGKLATIDELIPITKTIGGKKTTRLYEKWELLTSHTGRRSLVSNCILAGINPNSIMLLSGHKSVRVFQSYVRVNEEQNADLLSTHTFFSPALKAV